MPGAGHMVYHYCLLKSQENLRKLVYMNAALWLACRNRAFCVIRQASRSQAVKSLAHAQDNVMSLNAYHNKAHIGQVIMAAGLLADKASFSD